MGQDKHVRTRHQKFVEMRRMDGKHQPCEDFISILSRFFSRTFLAEFSLISEVRSFSLLACILEQECRKYLGINLRKYLYFSQG